LDARYVSYRPAIVGGPGVVREPISSEMPRAWSQRSCPTGPAAEDQQITYSDNHWSNTDTLMQMIDHVDVVLNPAGEQEPWLCLLDCAPCHIAAAWRERMRVQRPWIVLCYKAAGYTATMQPLDLAFMRSFKTALQRSTAEHFATRIVQLGGALGIEDLRPTVAVMRQSLMGFVASACREVDNGDHRVAGWKHMTVSDHERDNITEAMNIA